MPSLALLPLLFAASFTAGGDTTRMMRQVAAELPSLVLADSGKYGINVRVRTDSGTGALGRFASQNHHWVSYVMNNSRAMYRPFVSDTRAQLRAEALPRFLGDTTLVRTLAEAVERDGASRGGRTALPDPRGVSFRRVIDIAARFFYPDSILPDGRIQSHMCRGISGVLDMQGGRDPDVEAFVYSALLRDVDQPVVYIDGDFREATRLLNSMDLSNDPATRLERARGAMWALIVRSEKLRQVLLIEYQRTRGYLPFRIVDAPADRGEAARR